MRRPLSAASFASHAAPRVFHARSTLAPHLLGASSTLAPHEVGECHRLCPVSFLDFVCLLEGGRGEGFDTVCLFSDFVCHLGEEAEEGADVVCYSATSCVNSV